MKHSLLQSVKSIFNVLGYEIHKTSTRRTMDQVLKHIVSLNLKPKTVIDVGVASGTFHLYQAFPRAYHLLIEPNAEFENHLKKICSTYKGKYVLAAAGKIEGTIIDIQNDYSASPIHQDTDGKDVDGVPREIPITTIDKLCEQYDLKAPYVLKIDAEGAEIDVLEGATRILEQTELILLEMSFFQFYKYGSQFHDVIAYMKEHGFVTYDLFGGHNRPFDGALAQIDVAFVKEFGQFRKYHFHVTPKQRVQIT